MIEIIKKGEYKKPILSFRCERCNTQFKTDEWLKVHAPVWAITNKPSGPDTLHTICPICHYGITSKI